METINNYYIHSNWVNPLEDYNLWGFDMNSKIYIKSKPTLH